MKKIIFILQIFLILICFTGCYDARGIEELAYVVAIGLDTSGENQIELSLQFATASKSSSSSESSGSSSQSKETNITTIKCNTINSGIALINSHISKKINLSHCKVLVISEELAKKGISRYIDTLCNNIEIKADCSVIVSKCDAKEYLENVKPALENLTARYYESTINSAEYTGYTVDMTLAEFYSKTKDSYCEPYAILGSITKEENSSSPEINAKYFAGDNPIDDKDIIDNLGIAVFKDDKFIGELTGLDSLCHVIITNELDECTLTVPKQNEKEKYFDLLLTPEKCTKCSVSFENDIPHININVSLRGKGLSINENSKYSTECSIDEINTYASKYLKDAIMAYLNKTSKEYGSDICGFGKYAVKNYLTIDDWYSSNWLENYQNADFSVNVSITVESGAAFMEQ
ncbi:MAG: Ger(x)C family spore germination protein [Clostridia bacterium]|nr:Ger(x)C family spore germination protein [Clostridia bacterium]